MTPAPTDVLPFVAPCRHLSPGAPWRWIRLGWRDLLAAPRQSLSYGLVIFLVSAAVSYVAWSFGSGWMLLDRRVDGVTAVVTSINAVLRNKPAMLVWSLLIVAAITIGFATALSGNHRFRRATCAELPTPRR